MPMHYSHTLKTAKARHLAVILIAACAALFLVIASNGAAHAQAESTSTVTPAVEGNTVVGQSGGPSADEASGWGAMSPEERNRAIQYSGTRHTFYFIDFIYWAIVLLVILFTGFSGTMWSWAEKIGKRRLPALFLYLVMFIVLITLADLPFSYYLDFHLEHQYGLSNQSFGAWVGDGLISLGLVVVFGFIIAWIFYALVRACPRTWWAWLGVVAVPLLVIVIVIAPVVITPLYYETTPMEDSALKAQILDLAEQSGIPDSRVFVMDASKNTRKLNAYVTGLGQTKRIVLFDNLITEMKSPEVLFVVGHEMAHYLLHHVWIGLAIAVISVFVFGFLSHLIMGSVIAAHHRRLRFDRLSTPASMPLVVLCFSVCGFVFAPIQNGAWRHFEHAADVFGLEKTGDGAVAAAAFEKLAAVNLSNPNPSTFIKFWLYDHPTLSERVRFANAYEGGSNPKDSLRFLGERHLANVSQLTFGGENAEAYFDKAGERLIFQSTRGDYGCDRIFTMNVDGSNMQQVSVPGGATTCSFFAPDTAKIIYCSTYLVDDSCPPKPPRDKGYVWKLYEGFDVFSANEDGSNVKRLTDTPGYDAEAVYSPDGSKILFTSMRDGDLELYTMNPDGSDQTRITYELGYDGGAFFAPDGQRIVYRANHPETPEEIADYQQLLKDGLIRPMRLEVFVCNADGSNRRQVTNNGAANFCPYFHPNGEQIVFASNMDDPQGRNFELYLINVDGTGLERITYNESFDGFPMFNADGTKLVWASNRNNRSTHETNIFIADWIERE
jgi:TolB protein